MRIRRGASHVDTSDRASGRESNASVARRAQGADPRPRKSALASIALEQIPGGALFLDEHGRIADANDRIARIFGRRRRELRGHALAEWIPDWVTLDKDSGDAAHRRIEMTGLRADGSRMALRVARREVQVDGEPCTLVFIADCERRKALELQVRDATYGFHQIARAMPNMLWTCDPEGFVRYVSPQWIAFTGQPQERHSGHGWFQYVHSDDRPETLRLWRRAVERKETFKAEFRVRRFDGEHRWFDSTCLPVRDSAGAIVRWMGSNVDIHDAHQLQQALIEERDRLSKIAETAPGAFYSYRMRPDGSTSFAFSSAGIVDIYGMSREELAEDASKGAKYIHPDDVQRVRASMLESACELTPWRCEWRLLNPQKGEIWVEARSVPTREADGGTLWYGIMVDVTERKRAEEALRRSQARLEAAVRAGGIGTWIFDVRKNFLWRDEQLQKLLSRPPAEKEESGPEAARRYIHPEDWPKVARAIAQLSEGKTDAIELEYRNLRADNALQWIAVTGRAERDANGRILHVTGACSDITARKVAEESQRRSQRLEALGTLAGGIAHDFNNILLAITGNARLALSELPSGGPPDLPLRRNLLEIDKASARATDLVHQILAFSRQHDSRREVIQLRGPIEEAVKLLRATLPAMIAIRTNLADDAPAVLADSTQIHQVIMNLVTNSAYAIGDNPGWVSVSSDTQSVAAPGGAFPEELASGQYVRVTVSDNGAGMDRATLERIFDPFFTTKPAGQGTGLGLSVVHGIMRSHQGAISVESEPGGGSTFRLYFPAADEHAIATPDTQREAPRGAGQRILYVDDEESLVYLASRVLERLGYQVAGFTDPAKALQTFRQNPSGFDVVVTDLSMPGMSGFHLARALLDVRPDTPVLMTSGYVRPQDREAAQQLGIRELMLKPDTIEELGHALARLFDAEKSRKE